MTSQEPNVWIVVGSSGEYSDFTQWNVKGYTDKAKAEEHARLANEFENTVRRAPGVGYYNMPKNPYDADCRRDYTGTDYDVVGIFVDDLPGGAK